MLRCLRTMSSDIYSSTLLSRSNISSSMIPKYTQIGACISMSSCLLIVWTYLYKRQWRRHPNSLLFWKAFVDLMYALRFLFAWDFIWIQNPFGCSLLASMTQFLSYASECWFLSMSLDLYHSSTNPFANIKQNLKCYHVFSWTFSFCMGFLPIFLASNLLEEQFDPKHPVTTCFINEKNIGYLLMYYLVVILFVLCAFCFSVLENQSYFFGGMQEALHAKKHVIRSARLFTVTYIVYQLVLIALWASDVVLVYKYNHWSRLHQDTIKTLRGIANLLQGSKGFINLIIWVAVNGFPVFFCSKLFSQTASSSASALMDNVDSSTIQKEKNDALMDKYSDIDIDLQPELNVALRKEVLHFTTRGIVAASTNASKLQETAIKSRNGSNHTPTVVRLRLHELGMIVRFNDYHPLCFRDIRKGFGIKESLYRKAFLSTCHERIESGGSSGAFMFYTADYTFLVKTITKNERNVLLRMLPAYLDYMKFNPDSHLPCFYGCHSIEMYGQTFSFVVMGNVIGRISMHQFYDIKGSWINRHAQAIPPGKTVICTYCSQAFRYGSSEPCEYSIGGNHLPHIVLKDNDFHRKLRLEQVVAEQVIVQLEKDSSFLCSQGIMDYSLLLSIHSTKYAVDSASFDVTNPVNSPTKRKINYAVCHPVSQRSNSSRNAMDSFVSLNNGERLITPHSSSASSNSADEEDEILKVERGRTDMNQDDEERIEASNRQIFNRSCRFSIVTNTENNLSYSRQDSIPLLSKKDAPNTPQTSRFGTFDTSTQTSMKPSTESSQIAATSRSKTWIGTRSIHKVGYQACAVVGPDYYTMGLVDILQTWTWRKRLERFWKIYVLRLDGDGLSAAPPKQYAERFQRKMRDIMMVSTERIGFGHQ